MSEVLVKFGLWKAGEKRSGSRSRVDFGLESFQSKFSNKEKRGKSLD